MVDVAFRCLESTSGVNCILRFFASNRAASAMAAELTASNAAYLRGRTGREPGAGDLYAAHFLGPGGAAKLMEAMTSRPGASAVSMFPEAAAANRSIFYRDGHAVSVAQVYANLAKAAGPAGVSAPADAAPVNDDGGFIEYASARRDDRARQQDALVSLILRGSQPSDELAVGSRVAGSMFTTEMLKVLADSRSDS